jgi:transposase
VSIVPLSLPVVCAARTPSARFAAPPWNQHSPEWIRLDHKLPADHPARRINAAVDQLDLTPLFDAYAGTGSLAHPPDLLLKVALLQIQRGRPSPAQWYEDLRENEACQWLAFGLRPARSRLYAFRDRLGPVLDQLHNHLIGQAVAEQLTPATRAALDGSAVAANSSRHRLLHIDALANREQALQEATKADAAAVPLPALPGWMAATPAGRLHQQQHYEKAREQLTLRHEENQQRPASKRLAAKEVRISPGDPEAVLGLDKLKVYRPLYNVQLMPDLDTPLILAYEVFAQATDANTLPTMLRRSQAAVGRAVEAILADAGYATALDLAACAEAGVTLYAPYQENDFSSTRVKKPGRQIPKSEFRWLEQEQVYVCPEGHRLEYMDAEYERRKGGERLRMSAYRCAPAHCQGCPRQRQCTRSPERGRMVKRSEHEHLVEALRQRMQTEAAKELYKKRGQVVELGFADVKEHRSLRSFGGRGLYRARIEVGLVVLAHNVLSVLTLRQEKQSEKTSPTRVRVSA